MGRSDLRFAICDLRCVGVALVLFGNLATSLAADAIQFEPAERWSAVFAEGSAKWSYRVSAEQPFRERAAWRFAVQQRTIASGEVEVRGDKDRPAELLVPLRFPSVKDGAVLEARLTITVRDVRHDRPVWVFPANPFADREEWLKQLKLSVFDPPGDTVKQFETSEIPHTRLRQRDSLDDVTEGMIVIGEQVSLAKHEGLMDDLRDAAARGIPVLCLASDDGQFTWPGNVERITSVSLRRADVIRKLDKRLDAAFWPPGKSSIARGLSVTTRRDDVVAEISEEPTAWPWCEWQVARTGHVGESSETTTRVIWCGFRIIDAWNDGPTPRYLFSKMLERLGKRQNEKEDTEH